MSRDHPPPPTKFGPGSVQAKPAQAIETRRIPPPTRFGAALVPQQQPSSVSARVPLPMQRSAIASPATPWRSAAPAASRPKEHFGSPVRPIDVRPPTKFGAAPRQAKMSADVTIRSLPYRGFDSPTPQPGEIRSENRITAGWAAAQPMMGSGRRTPGGHPLSMAQYNKDIKAEADRLGQRAADNRIVAHKHRATIQMASSSAKVETSFLEDIYFAYRLTERERTDLLSGTIISLGNFPIHGNFSAHNLTADLHVSSAQQGLDVNKKLKDALNKIKYCMEYAAKVHSKNVREGVIELRPTGGVVVKQMIELLAFVGQGMSKKLEMKKKLDQLKELRNKRIHEARAAIEYLKKERDKRLQDTGGNVVLALINQHPEVDENPSPGMAELIRQAKTLRGGYDVKIKELESFVGERTGHAMASAFFDEHFYMLQSLIDRGRIGYFSVSAFGLANELDEHDPHLPEIASNKNVLLLGTPAGHKARKIYTKRLYEQNASLRVSIYYDAIADVIATIPG